jgi:hypothetical protein
MTGAKKSGPNDDKLFKARQAAAASVWSEFAAADQRRAA